MIKKYIFMTLLMVWAQHSVAYTCTNKTPSTQATFTTNNISIAANVPVGTEIARATTGTVATFSCVDGSPSDLKNQLLAVKGLGTYLMNLGDKRIYSTNIKGIGYAVYGEDDRCGGNGVFVGQNTVSGDGNPNNSWVCGVNGSSATGPLRVRGEIVFYKIAEFTGSGVLSIGNAASFILQVNQAQWIYPETNITIAPYSISSRACEVSQTSINVPMGSVPKNHFNGIGTGAFASHTKNFTIGLNCNPDTKIKVKLDGNIQNANQGILNLTSSDTTAKGVGIQLLFNNSPLILGQPFYIGTSNTNGLYNINLSARYYQIGNISSGTANSTATFTMTYE